jgi:putative NADPH-quinone reductase
MQHRRILIVDGHPDAAAGRYVHALCRAYYEGARKAGHDVRCVILSELPFPLLRSSEEFHSQQIPRAIRDCQESLQWADHLVFLYPLWLGDMPALTKGFLEQVLRPGFAFTEGTVPDGVRRPLAGKSARVVVTMGMPAAVYRVYFGSHSLRALQRNILHFCGIRPVRASVIGSVETMGQARRGVWLARMQGFGERAC